MRYTISDLQEKAFEARARFIELFSNLGYGHLTTAFSETEILISLFLEVMDYEPQKPDSDRFVLSKGHGAGMLFPIFELAGLMTKEETAEILKVGGSSKKFNRLFYPGFDFYGGSLGMGLGMATGLSLASRMNRSRSITYCLMGDAECYEGSVWEAMLFAGHNELNNLVAIIDRNYLGCSDFTEDMCRLEPFEEKWRSCNWDVINVDGHDIKALTEAMRDVEKHKSKKPLCVIADTVKGKGVDYLCNIPLMHGFMPKGENAAMAIRALYDYYEDKE